MNVEIITAVKKRMKEELLPRQMEKLEIVLHEVFQEQENKKEKKNLVKKFINVKRDSAVQWQQGQLTRGCPPSRCRFFWDTQRLTPPAICQCTTGKCKAFSSEVHLLNCRKKPLFNHSPLKLLPSICICGVVIKSCGLPKKAYK